MPHRALRDDTALLQILPAQEVIVFGRYGKGSFEFFVHLVDMAKDLLISVV